MKFYRTPRLFRRVYPGQTWSLPCNEPVIYLTFDDGPTEKLTNWILDTLQEHDAQATFFCVGNNVINYPERYSEILRQGHSVGNHTMHHVNGWKTSFHDYLENVNQASQHISSSLFRPPYGKIKRSQQKKIGADFRTIMWSFLTYDFDPNVDMHDVFNRYIRSYQQGDILVLHDNVKAEKQLKIILPLLLKWGQEKGIQFKRIQ